mgnify:CR=1 FL=1
MWICGWPRARSSARTRERRLCVRHCRHRRVPRARSGLGIWLQAAYNSFQTPRIFAATFVIIIMTGLLLLAVHAVERLTIGAPADDDDPDAQ